MSQTEAGTPDLKPRSNPARLWIVLALAFLGYFVLMRGVGRNRSVGRQADYSWVVSDLEGRRVDLAQYRGRPIFLNVWASWCPPCVREMPSIARLASNPKLKGAAFLCVSEDQSVEEAAGFFSSGKPPMTILHSPGPRPAVFSSDNSIPATFVIAPDGRIVLSEIGGKEWDDEETIRLLEGLVREAR